MVAVNLLAISLAVAIIGFLAIVKFLPASKLWGKLTLDEAETAQAGFSSSSDYGDYLGKEGVVLSLLRPAGVMLIDGVKIDVVSEGQYIEPGAKVKVVSVNGSRIVVRCI